MVVEMVNALGNDASYFVDWDGNIHVTFNDFEGFDENWEEVEREYDDGEAVNAFVDRLETEALKISGDYYCYYQMNGFFVIVGYASMDI